MAELLALTDLTLWNKVSTAAFLSLFALLFLWTYRPGAKGIYDQRGHIPLDDGKVDDGK